MAFNRYVVAAIVSISAVAVAYIVRFGWQLDADFAVNPADWGTFGDYVGGILNPVLSFISIILLIQSLNLQNEANAALRSELKNTEQTEKLKSFSTLFFHMIASQKDLFDSFKFSHEVNGTIATAFKVNAVLTIENEIESRRDAGEEDDKLCAYLEELDSDDYIFGLLRAFYIIVKTVSDKLTNENGFASIDRKNQLLTLINFTDFAQLRLILIAIQFLRVQPAEYLRGNEEFTSVLADVGLKLDPY